MSQDVPAAEALSTWSTSPKDVVVDLNNHTYSTVSSTGSSGTKTQALHFEKGTDITLKNGTIEVDPASTNTKMMMQNYANLTMKNMVIDTSNVKLSVYSFPETSPYYEEWNGKTVPVFNFNNGSSVLENTTVIFQSADTNGLYVSGPSDAYPEGAYVILKGNCVINGPLTVDSKDSENRLIILGGTYSVDPTAYVPKAGYTITKNSNGTWTVKPNN